jgi:threonine synthase
MMKVVCHACDNQVDFSPFVYRCACGNAWEPAGLVPFDPAVINSRDQALSRYMPVFGALNFDWSVSLGAGWTPLVSAVWEQEKTYFKLEYLSPTGSFKDRGTEVEVAYFKAVGITHVVEDSSGNAGASMAAYAAKAGIRAGIFAPNNASRAKLDQITIFGAELHLISGPRSAATEAALEVVEQGAVYASHAYNPVYLMGQCTFAWEIWEQTDGNLPGAIIIPVGQGGLLLGAYFGFKHLLHNGIINQLPRLFAVQSDLCAPLKNPFLKGKKNLLPYEYSTASLADGVAIARPVRASRILEALYESGGGVITISEHEIKQAYFSLAEKGFFTEPTSALAAAAIPQVRHALAADEDILVALTGSGFKTSLLVK